MTNNPSTSELKFVRVFGFSVFSDSLYKISLDNIQSAKLINTISPNSYGISTKDVAFSQALKNTDFLVLDGVYFALASILTKGKGIKINQGFDVFYHFLTRLNKEKGKAFFLGSTNQTLEKIKKRLSNEYSEISVDYFSPPFKAFFSKAENAEIINRINSFCPDIVFVGMTAPKQEKWAYHNYKILKAKLVISIGAVFDWYAGNEKEVSMIWWKLRLGWLIRTINRPEILKRYPNIGIFFWHLFLAVLRIKKYR